MPMPASPDAAPTRSIGRVRSTDLALADPGEWSPDGPAMRPRHAPSADPSPPGLAICAALMAVALMIAVLDPSLRASAAPAPACTPPLHGEHSDGPPRRGRLVRMP